MTRKPIYLILLFAFIIRLYHITFPVSGWHSWRQADTAAIAKNFYENGFNILYPQIDWGGSTPGYVESEFQLYPFIVSLLYYFFGVNDFGGRILSVIFSVLTIYGLYLLTRKIISETAALWSAFIYAVIPLNIYYSRSFMPESMMLMCIVYGILFFYMWIKNERWKYYWLSFIFISLAILLKIPTLYIGLPLLYLAYQKYKVKSFAKPMLWLFAVLVLLPVFLWYYHAHELLLNGGFSFGIWGFGVDKWGNFNLLITPSFYNDIFVKSIAERHLTYAGFILFVVGLFIKRTHDDEKLFDFWLISVLIYFLIVSGGNKAHEYYQLPFILPAAVFAGKVFAKFLPLSNIKGSVNSHKIRFSFFSLCLILMLVLSYLRFSNFMGAENYDSPIFKMSREIRSVTGKNDLIITVCDGNPVYLYLSDRKGWFARPDEIDDKYIYARESDGAVLIAGMKSFFETASGKENLKNLIGKYKVIKNNDDYFVIKLVNVLMWN